jgi:hypothetical protein
MNRFFAHFVCRMLIVCLGACPLGAYAGMIGTDQIAAATQAQDARARLRSFVGRSELRQQLQELGISPAAAQARVNAMTDTEVASVVGQIERLPAGGVSGWAVGVSLIVIGLIWYYWVK